MSIEAIRDKYGSKQIKTRNRGAIHGIGSIASKLKKLQRALVRKSKLQAKIHGIGNNHDLDDDVLI